MKTCIECRTPFESRFATAITCGPVCAETRRQRLIAEHLQGWCAWCGNDCTGRFCSMECRREYGRDERGA